MPKAPRLTASACLSAPHTMDGMAATVATPLFGPLMQENGCTQVAATGMNKNMVISPMELKKSNLSKTIRFSTLARADVNFIRMKATVISEHHAAGNMPSAMQSLRMLESLFTQQATFKESMSKMVAPPNAMIDDNGSIHCMLWLLVPADVEVTKPNN